MRRWLWLGVCALMLVACGDDGGSSGAPGDRDADGIADDIDSCPLRPGPSPTGCPQLAVAPVSGPSGTLVTVVGSGFFTDTVVQFGGVDARTVYVDNFTVVAVVPFADEGTLEARAPGSVSVQIAGVSASVEFEVTELLGNHQSPGSVLATAAMQAADELAELRGDIDAGLVAARALSSHQQLTDLVDTSRAAYDAVAGTLTGLPQLGLPADVVDVIERLLLAAPAAGAGAPVCDSQMDAILCQRTTYAARVQHTRQLARVLCGFGLVAAGRQPELAADLAQACAAASFADELGAFVLGVDVTGVDLVGPQAIEVGDEASYTPRVTVVNRSALAIPLPRVTATLAEIASTPLADATIDAWHSATIAALYYLFWELQQNTERSGDASAANFAWWAADTALDVEAAGRVRLRRQPAFAPVLLTAQLLPQLQSRLEQRRGLTLPCSSSQTCRAAAISVGAQLASLELTAVSCERVADVAELGGGPGLRLSVTGTATGPVAATLGALVPQQPGVFVKASDTNCGGWSGGALDCTRTQSQPEQTTFDYRLVCADNAATPCPPLPAGFQVDALVSDSSGTTLASRAQFVTCAAQ